MLETPPDLESLEIAPARAPKRQGWLRRIFGMRFLVISIAVHLLLGLFAAVWVVQSYSASRKLTFKGGPPSPNKSTRAIEHQVQLAKKQSSMSAPANKRIVSTGLSKITLPEMPAMPKTAAQPSKMAGAGGANLGAAAGPMGAVGDAGGGGLVSMFGLREASGGGLQGSIYDLKQTSGRQPTKMDPNAYGGIVAKFVKNGWNAAELSMYFKAPTTLYSTQFLIPSIKADDGPKAFQAEREVKPGLWLALYKGQVSPPESGTFHFVGGGDDILFVRFNNRTVLNGSWNIKDSDAGTSNTGHYDYHWPNGQYPQPGGFTKGEAVQVEGGKTYPIEILIGEQPGGDFHAVLLIEKEGNTYPKDNNGNPILPVFKTADTKPLALEKGQNLPPHDEKSPVIWRGTAAPKATSALDALKKP